MADPITIATAVVNVIKALNGTIVLINAIQKAPLEAKHVANQLEAAQAILTSLKRSLDTVNHPQHFLKLWGASARLVLDNIKLTIEQMQKRLGGPGSTGLSTWRRIAWPYEREEGLALQQQLQGYMQMLGLVQNGLLQYEIILYIVMA